LPILNALRECFPQAYLTVLAAEPAADLLDGHQALDELIVPPASWLGSTWPVWQLRRRLQALAADVAIDLAGSTAGALALRLSGAGQRIAFGDTSGIWSRRVATDLVAATAAEPIDRSLELLRPLGIHSPRVQFNIPADPIADRAALRMIRRVGLEEGFVLISPAAGKASGAWPVERFALLAGHLVRAWQLPSIVVWSGPEERALAHALVARSEGYVWQAPATGLREVAALARRARLFVGPDSGPLKLASALGTPCVALDDSLSAEQATAACDDLLHPRSVKLAA
jgi:ADP-heptose:LPS heptosyltransferase